MDSDGFIPVRYTKKQRRRCRSTSSTCSEITCESSLDYTKETALRKILNAIQEVSESEYFLTFMSILERTVEVELGKSVAGISSIICYGLGSLCRTTKSIEQFAFLVNLQRRIEVEIEFYDPIFTDVDKEIISEEYKFIVLPENEEGRRNVDKLSLFYLPHCPHMLSNNLLVANWSPDLLPNCIIVSNGFAKILDNRLHPEKSSFEFISKAKPVTLELVLKNTFVPMDVFNDISIHVFPQSKCDRADVPEALWNVPLTRSRNSESELDNEMVKCRHNDCDEGLADGNKERVCE